MARAEIADACAAIAREVRDGKISGDRVTEKMIAEHLYNPDIPDCDLVIRTSGEQRTSNFLPWKPPTRNSTSCRNCSRIAAVMCCGAPSTTTSTARSARFGGVKK